MARDVFDKTTKYLKGQQTERQIRDASPISPPSLPGELLRNRKGDLILASVTNLPPTIPVDSDENPTLYPLCLDTSGNLRVILPNGTTVAATVDLIEVGGVATSLGQKLMAASIPVVLASDQTTIPVTVTFPARQAVNLDQIGGAAYSEGQKVMAASAPVVLASDQTAIPVSGFPAEQNVNLNQVNSVPISSPSADAPLGTETAQITRNIFRKRQTLLTSTPLGANGVFTSPWFDTELTGTCYVMATGISNVVSAATLGLSLQESEDQANARAVFQNGAAAISRSFGFIRMRYWRIVYTNGATLQASFSLYATESSLPIIGLGVPGTQTLEPVAICTPTVAAAVLADAQSNQNGAPIQTSAGNGEFQLVTSYLFNGATWDRPRTPNIFKQVATATTGSTALWTPAAGKKFRVMRFRIQVTALAKAAAGADLKINLLDAAGDIGLATLVTIPTAALTVGDDYDSGWIDLGNGILSALANNVLNLNLSFALTGGQVNANVCGTEE